MAVKDTDEVEIELDDDGTDVEATMREAVAAVEEVKEGRGRRGAGDGGGEATIERLEQELADLRDRSIRTLADFDNYRKRAERERRELSRYALLEPMREVVEVIDNLERALGAGGSADDLKQGVSLILRQMQDLLRRLGIEEVPAVGEPFDPACHEAVARRDADDIDEPMVVEELQRGYRLHDRLLRPSRVAVAMPSEGGKTS